MVTKHKMKNTEIGFIPEDWDVKPLSDIGVFSKGFGITRDQAQSGNIPCIRYGEIYTTHHNYIRRFCSYISQEIANTSTKLKTGDILFAGSGETKEEIGKAVAFVGREDAYGGGDIIILSPKINVSSLFLGFVLNNESSVKQKSSLGQGDAVVHIHAKELAGVLVPFPNHDEQHAIASVLSEMDTMILRLEQAIAKKKLMKDGAMQQLLTGRIRLNNSTNEWIQVTFGDVISRFATGLNPRQNFTLNSGGSCNYVTIKDFKDGVLNFENCDKINQEACELINRRSDLRVGDLLFSSIGRVGDAYVIKEEATDWNINESVYNLRPRHDLITSDFLYYIIKSHEVYQKLQDAVTGSTLRSIKMNHLKAISFTIPPTIEEQIEIATILSSMDNEIQSLEAEKNKYISIKQGMMQKLLTGQIRLPQSCLKEE